MLPRIYGCGIRQLQRLVQNGVPISDYGEFNKRNRKPEYREIKELTLKDYDYHRAQGRTLSGPQITEYAQINAENIIIDPSNSYSDDVKDKYLNATFGKSFINVFKKRYEYLTAK